MKKSVFKSALSALVAMCFSYISTAETAHNDAMPIKMVVDMNRIDTTSQMGNKVSNYNYWDAINEMEPFDKSEGMDTSFVEYGQIMQATGGEYKRDPFKDPKNFDVLDDYDFSKLINACEILLKNNIKPYVKFSVPRKLSKSDVKGEYMNPFPPLDYEQYYKFATAVCKALTDKFGKEECSTWRYGLFTEYENYGWFRTLDENPENTMKAYFKLFDYTVDAVQKNISPTAQIGAHAMGGEGSFWDPTTLFEHCVNGTNYKTGKKGTKLDIYAISFYESTPDRIVTEPLIMKIVEARTAAEKVGLKLIYGVDEGRMAWGDKGRDKRDLLSRITGDSYQISYEAKLAKTMFDNDIDYFASWGYSSGKPHKGFPHTSYYVARSVAKFKNCNRVGVLRYLLGKTGWHEVNGFAGFDKKANTLRIMGYSLKHCYNDRFEVPSQWRILAPQFAGKEVKISTLTMDYKSNFCDEFKKDRKIYKLKDSDFTWSPNSVQLDLTRAWCDKKNHKLYMEKLRPKYVKMSKIEPEVKTVKVGENGVIDLSHTFCGNSAVFFEITPVEK